MALEEGCRRSYSWRELCDNMTRGRGSDVRIQKEERERECGGLILEEAKWLVLKGEEGP